MKAIVTTYHGPTEHRPSRITASDGDGNRATVPCSSSDGRPENAHFGAALALCKKLGWTGTLVVGGLAHGRFVFVFADGLVFAVAPTEGGA